MHEKKVKVINLFAGPGCGKSTAAAFVFSMLKSLGVNAELVTEVAKDITWEENFKALTCQPYIAGKQIWRIDRCADGADVIVTDSPIMLTVLYNNDKLIEPSFTETVAKKFSEYDNLNYVLSRVVPYSNNGRSYSYEESKLIDAATEELLHKYSIPYTKVSGGIEGYIEIVDDVFTKLDMKPQWEELKQCLKNL